MLGLTGASIVVVDDDPDTRDILRSVLESAGATVHLAASAAEGLSARLEKPPDALISDIAMPGQDGYSLLQQLGDDAPRATIALTAFAGPRDQRRAAEAGFDRHMAKPFDAERLVQMLRDLLFPGNPPVDRETSLPTR